MTDLLYLVHRLPYPPNKGDKIRSYHILKYLAERYDVHLGCFVDDREDLQYVIQMKEICKSTCIRKLSGIGARVRSLRGLFSGEALSVPFYQDRGLATWVDRTIVDYDISNVVAFSSPMAQYVLGDKYSKCNRIMDFVDIDSDKWRQYASRKKLPQKWIYQREAQCLAAFEQTITEEFDSVIFVSENETDAFAAACPTHREKIFAIRNGVNVGFFDSAMDLLSPFPPGSMPVVFTGMMDYWPNADAVRWFATTVFPQVQKAQPSAEFWIVGASPDSETTGLASLPGVHVTGRVDDVRPYIRNACVVVAPLRIARGVQNKILEALAMGQTVVCTSQAAAGLFATEPSPVIQADTADDFAARVLNVIDPSQVHRIEASPRQYVLQNYDWERNLQQFGKLLASPERHAAGNSDE